ncbi:MAG TPA: DUF393 domain-containing protein [Capsulimonadaceae bacterium]|jgi:predicted DCC family thiol-disulfide oxidoreductase YuxK
MARKLEVYYDGSCGFCLIARDRFGDLDRFHRILFRDLNDIGTQAELSVRFGRSVLESQMHAKMPNGSWRVGYFAVAEIVRQLPYGSLVARVMLFPPLAELGNAVYRWFASNRREIADLLGMPPPCNEGACLIEDKDRRRAGSFIHRLAAMGK